MAIAGFVRLRKHQFGRQTAANDLAGATRAYPFKGTPSVELNWTDPDIDTGSIDPVAAPYREAPALTASLTAPVLNYNDLPLMLSGFFGGDVAGTGTDEVTWVYAPVSATVDAFDHFTYQFGDDVLTDWFQFGDGILESLDFEGPEGLGPITASMSWMFGSVRSTGSTDFPVDNGAVPTPGLALATNDAIVYLKDMKIAIASSVAGLAAGQVSDALHSMKLSFTQGVDQKRFANGSQVFDVDAYGRTERGIELECTFAKTSDIVGIGSESDAWMSDTSVNRYVRLTFTSTAIAHGTTPYSWVMTMPMRYYTRAEGEVGGNTAVVLTGHAFYDPTDLGGVFKSTLVNTLHAASLES